MTERRSLSVTDAAKQLGVGKDTLYRRIDRRTSSIDLGWTTIRVLIIGQRIVVPQAEIDRALCEGERGEAS